MGIQNKIGRLGFLKYAGATIVGSTTLFQACKKNNDDGAVINLGSGDTGILNYAYVLKQLAAVFYTHVVENEYASMTSNERDILNDIQKHEIAHRELFKTILGSNAIIDLETDLSNIAFSSRSSVLNTAKVLEDLSISAYNGAGKLTTSLDYLLLISKVVSVEARHASAIRSLLSPNTASFAGDDIVASATGLDTAKSPSEVLKVLQTYLKSKVSVNDLPTS